MLWTTRSIHSFKSKFERRGVLGDLNAADSQIRERRQVHIAPLVERHGDPVDDLVRALLPDLRLNEFGLVTVDVVAVDNVTHLLDAAPDEVLVVGRAVLAEEILQHVGGHYGVVLHQLGQVLAHDLPLEVVDDLSL